MNKSVLKDAIILVVDDDPTNLGVLFNELQQFDCTVLLAQDGQTAVELAQKQQPHIILLDVLMPGINGFDTCRILKSDPLTASIPVLFLSALHDTIDQMQGFEAGGVDYITKPFKSNEVVARMVTHLTLWQLQESLKQQNEQLQDEIKKRQTIENKLRYSSIHDDLTGLPNRTMLFEQLQSALDNRQNGSPFALLFLDLDRFKIINDSLGHLRGDVVLRLAAERIKETVGQQDLVTRFGGDEFGILLNDIQSKDAVFQVASKICAAMSHPFNLESQIVHSGASIGIVFSNDLYKTPDDLLRDADVAMYRAKALGGLRYQAFDQSMYLRALARLELEAAIRHAIDNNELELYFQPIVSAKSNRATGAEALIRWNHPEKGLIFPDNFLPVAEETSLIVGIGRWIMEEAFRAVKSWHQSGYEDLFIAVNMSARQLNQPGLIDWISQLLIDYNLSPSSLEIEITEGIMTRASEITILQQLSAMGIQISIDDFGVGSSMECLKYFPLDILKIDQSFVRNMMSDDQDKVIVRAIIAMAHSLDLKVIAEGVEAAEQLTFLQEQNCDEIQGYYYSPSIPPDTFLQFLKDQA